MPRPLLFAIVAFASLVMSCKSSGVASLSHDRTRLLALHEQAMQAHRDSNADLIMRAEAPDYVVASRGAITQPTLDARRAFFTRYLESTRFTEYADVVPPIVKVSDDGSLGWVIVQVRASGVQTKPDGSSQPVAFESAWIELYEKRDGIWLRVGNVSNFKP